eukprot:1240875-Amphidinium_carterae.1
MVLSNAQSLKQVIDGDAPTARASSSVPASSQSASPVPVLDVPTSRTVPSKGRGKQQRARNYSADGLNTCNRKGHP